MLTTATLGKGKGAMMTQPFQTLWRASRPLTATAIVMAGALAASLAALWLDPRVIGGAPAWLKPAKFAASTAIYSLTLAWLFRFLPDWPRTRNVVGWTTSLVFIGEVVIIDLQAWRGTTSHFNVSTPLDAALFSAMGLGILVQTLASIAVAVAVWRQRFADRAVGWALRLGMTITIAGAMSGGLMTQPTRAQLADARATGRMTVSGAHTVGAPDGGPGLPGTGWSVTHGDLRVAHFIGLHAVQALPFFAVVVLRRRPEAARVRLVVAIGASYAALFAILMWQAFRGEPVTRPGMLTTVVLFAWAVLSAAAARQAAANAESERHAALVY
jgi:hypothetical protein